MGPANTVTLKDGSHLRLIIIHFVVKRVRMVVTIMSMQYLILTN